MGAVAQLTDLSPLFKKHVTFSDHSESGYSSTTQRDEGIKQRMNLQNLKLANQGSPHHDNAALLQRMNMSEKQKLSDTNQHHSEFSLKNPSHPIPPVYYDPLHLQNFSSFEKLSGTEQQLSESGSREEKSLSKNPKNAKNENKVTQNMSSLNPIQSRFIPPQPPVFVSIDHDPVVPFFAHDLSRVSAFTPVKPTNPHSSISRTEHKMLPHQFTPSKGPNVFECVGSIPDHSHVNPRNTISSNHYTTSKLEISKPVVDSNDIRSDSPNPHKMSSLNEILKAESNKRTFQNDPSYDSPLSSSGASNDDTLPTLKNDVLRLRRYFDSVGGKEMKRHLRNLVDSNNCDVIKALILLFPSTVTHHVEGHCVRCHKVKVGSFLIVNALLGTEYTN